MAFDVQVRLLPPTRLVGYIRISGPHIRPHSDLYFLYFLL
jgi:hypothetical protein